MPEVQTPPEGANPPVPQQPVATASTKKYQGAKKPKKTGGAAVRFVVWLIVVVVVVVLALIVAAYIARFDSVFDMFDYIKNQIV
jgi:hypothetical protein